MPKLVQFGAGNIGRGFIAHLFTESGWEVVFIDIDEKVIGALNKNRSYTLEIVGNTASKKVAIKNVRGVSGKDLNAVAEELAGADMAATAVGVNVLKNITSMLAEGIKLKAKRDDRKPLNIIIGENMINAGSILKGWISEKLPPEDRAYLEANIGFVETVLGRMIPLMSKELKEKDPLYTMAEEFCTLPVSKNGFKGEIPNINNMIPCENFLSYEERKLYIHNLGHAVCAYLGFLKGYEFTWQSVGDKDLAAIVRAAMHETGNAIIKKHNLPAKEVTDYVEDLVERFANKHLGDTNYRVGRDVKRKLSPVDRLIGSVKLCREQGVRPESIAVGIAAALLFRHPEDPGSIEISDSAKDAGVAETLEKYCGLSPEDDIIKLVEKKYLQLLFAK